MLASGDGKGDERVRGLEVEELDRGTALLLEVRVENEHDRRRRPTPLRAARRRETEPCARGREGEIALASIGEGGVVISGTAESSEKDDARRLI